MVKSDFYDETLNLMITTTDDPTKNLKKVGTDEVYAEAIDVIEGVVEVEGARVPYCRFIYEEIDKPAEELEEKEEE